MFGAGESAPLRAGAPRAAPRSRAVVATVAGESKKILMMGACSRAAPAAPQCRAAAPARGVQPRWHRALICRCSARRHPLHRPLPGAPACGGWPRGAARARCGSRSRAAPPWRGAADASLSRAVRATAAQVTLFTRGKTPIATQIPDDTPASFKAYESKIKHIKGNRQASSARALMAVSSRRLRMPRGRDAPGCDDPACAPPRRCVVALQRCEERQGGAASGAGRMLPCCDADGALCARRSRRRSRLR